MSSGTVSRAKVIGNSFLGRKPKYEEVAILVHQEIQNGTYGKKGKLPPLKKLVEKYGVSLNTIRQSVEQLANKGLVDVQHGRGIFVSNHLKTGEFGIVMRDISLSSNSSYCRIGYLELTKAIHQRYPNWRTNLYTGRRKDWNGPHCISHELIKSRDISHLSGVFTFEDIGVAEDLLKSHNIPIIGMNYFCTKYAIKFVSEGLIAPGLNFFGKIGCRSVAEIGFSGANCVYCRIKTKPENVDEWQVEDDIASFNILDLEEDTELEPYGYEAFQALWKNGKKVDGVLVTDNILCQGVLRAVSELGISIPEDLKLISHATRGVKFSHNRTITRLECDFSALANEAVNMMEQLIAGHKPNSERIDMMPELIVGETT